MTDFPWYLLVPVAVGVLVGGGYLFVTMRLRRRMECSVGMFVVFVVIELTGRLARWTWSFYRALDAFACEWHKVMTAPVRQSQIAAMIPKREDCGTKKPNSGGAGSETVTAAPPDDSGREPFNRLGRRFQWMTNGRGAS